MTNVHILKYQYVDDKICKSEIHDESIRSLKNDTNKTTGDTEIRQIALKKEIIKTKNQTGRSLKTRGRFDRHHGSCSKWKPT